MSGGNDLKGFIDMQNIQTAVLPFDLHSRRTLAVPAGMNLKEIVEHIAPPVFGDAVIYATINGEVIDPSHWKNIRPKLNAVVGVCIVPGKGGGGKNPLSTIITLVTLVAAPYLAGVYGASLAGAIYGGMGPVTASQFAVASGIIRVAVGAVGFLAASALSSAPHQSNQANAGNTGVRNSPTQFVEGASNQILRDGVVPICLGTNRMFPPQAALPYTETQNGDQYVRQLFTFGYGKVSISEEKIGDTLLSEFDDVEEDNKLDADLSDGTALYADDVYQEGLSVTITYGEGYTTRTTQADINEFEVDITFGEGLYVASDTGAMSAVSVTMEVGYSLTGVGSWTTETFTISGAQNNALRAYHRVSGLTSGTYDVRVKRLSENSVSVRQRDVSTWTALRSITHRNPVNMTDISGKAIRIKATDQLNGTVEKYNAIVAAHIMDYDGGTSSWVERVSSNPASLYRHVLQCPAFAKRLTDSRLNIPFLEDWHDYCVSLGLTYNKIIDYETSIDEVLNDIAAAGFASKNAVEGVYSIVKIYNVCVACGVGRGQRQCAVFNGQPLHTVAVISADQTRVLSIHWASNC
jgi:hypothetical protein